MKKTLIQHIEVTESGGRAAIEFTVIPQTYTDLFILLSSRSTRTPQNADGFWVKLNGVTPTARYLMGVNATATSNTNNSGVSTALGDTASTFANTSIYVTNYASTATYKSFSVDNSAENNSTAGYNQISANLYSSNTAVTSITIEHLNANFAQYSSASLYGVTAGNDGITTVS